MTLFSIIVVVGKNNVIGKDNKIPWELPEDRKRFHQLTIGHTVVMGRKTFESIGRPLKNRRNIVLTHSEASIHKGIEIAHSFEDAIRMTQHDHEVFILGGEETYKLFWPYVDKVYMTRLKVEFDGDRFFPTLGNEWKEIEREDREDFSFITYKRQI